MDTINRDKMMYDIAQMKPEDKLLLKQMLDNDISTDARINNLGTKVDGLRMDLVDLSRDMREYVRKYVDMTKEQQAKGLMEYLNEKTEQDATLKKIEDMKAEAIKKEEEESTKTVAGGLFSGAVSGLKNTFSGVNDMLNNASGTLSKMANDAVGNNTEEEQPQENDEVENDEEPEPEQSPLQQQEQSFEQPPLEQQQQSFEQQQQSFEQPLEQPIQDDILDEIEKNVIKANDDQIREYPPGKVMKGGGKGRSDDKLPKAVNEWINKYSKSTGKKEKISYTVKKNKQAKKKNLSKKLKRK